MTIIIIISKGRLKRGGGGGSVPSSANEPAGLITIDLTKNKILLDYKKRSRHNR